MCNIRFMRIEAVDLFCGIGGLSYGFKSEGFHVRAGIDTDSSCKYAFETNVEAPFYLADVSAINGRQIGELYSGRKNVFRVLIGCAPCTPFSIYTGRYRKRRRVDPHWPLLREFARLVWTTRPDVVTMENVPRLVRHRVFSSFVSRLKRAGYTVSYHKVRADHYGVPQRRVRLVLFASLWGEVRMVPPTHKDDPPTVRDAIGNLPRVQAGEPCKTDRLHVSRGLTKRNLLRLKATQEGGSWKDWKKDLVLSCHSRKAGRTFRSVYGRMCWDSPSPVITTQCLGIGNGRFGHPEQDRAISIREAALLQSFPKKFRFIPAREKPVQVHLARQIGNAVPVKLGRAIARSIKYHLKAVSDSGDGAAASCKPARQIG
jgi:DNA (cytosine-5)-methyltransferase 1